MLKFLAVVTVCGLYQADQRICLEWTDTKWHASRAQCMARGQEIVGKVKTLARYAGLKLETYPVPKCVQK